MREHSPRQHLDSTESLPEEEGDADEDALLPSMADGEDGSEEVDVAEGEVTELTDQLAELQELLAQKVLLINELQGTPGFSFSLSISSYSPEFYRQQNYLLLLISSEKSISKIVWPLHIELSPPVELSLHSVESGGDNSMY